MAWCQPLAPTPTPRADSPDYHNTSPVTGPLWQTAQRPPAHNPGTGVPRSSADAAAPPGRIEGGHLRDVTPVRTPSDTSSPADRPEQAHELALCKAFTAQCGPTGRAGRPGQRPLGTFGEHRFDDVLGQDTR